MVAILKSHMHCVGVAPSIAVVDVPQDEEEEPLKEWDVDNM